MSRQNNNRCVFRNRPGADKEPSVTNFGYESCDLPTDPSEGEITVKSLFFSLDPALRCRMNDDTGVKYMEAWEVGATVLGLGGVGLVTRSNNNQFKEGDIIQALLNWPWTTYFNTRTDSPLFPVYKVDSALVDNPQLVLSLLGLTGLTAYLGIKEKGHLTSGTNQTVVVSAAAGASGNLAGQISKLLGAKTVIGICGTDEKCKYLTEELGFDGAVNYKTSDITEKLQELCPSGVHAYFDNVGGATSENVISQMVENSHVILCGQIAVYNRDLPYPPPISEEVQNIIKTKNITRERFLVLNYQEQFEDGLAQIQQWYKEGQVKVPEFIHDGLESAGEAFVNMMTSKKQDQVGKQMVRVSLMCDGLNHSFIPDISNLVEATG